MRFAIRPGKVTCAGIVVIMMVLPNSLWKGSDAKIAPAARPAIDRVDGAKTGPNTVRRSVRFNKVTR